MLVKPAEPFSLPAFQAALRTIQSKWQSESTDRSSSSDRKLDGGTPESLHTGGQMLSTRTPVAQSYARASWWVTISRASLCRALPRRESPSLAVRMSMSEIRACARRFTYEQAAPCFA